MEDCLSLETEQFPQLKLPTSNVVYFNNRENYIYKHAGVKKEWNEAYLSLSKKWDLENDRVVTALNCGKHGGYEYVCEGEAHHKNYLPTHCQDIHYCPVCAEQYARKEGKNIFDLFGDVSSVVKNVSMLHIVATIPKDKWSVVDKSKLPKVWYRAIHRYLENDRKVSGTVSIHHWGDYGSVHRQAHLDVLMLNVYADDVKTTSLGDDGMLKRDSRNRLVYDFHSAMFETFDPFLDVDRLRRCWTDCLNDEFGWDIKLADIYTQYYDWETTDKRRLMHLCKYHVRMPITDVVKAWCDKKPIVDEDVKILLGLPKNFRRRRWFGWLSDQIVKRYLWVLGIEKCKCEQAEKFANENTHICAVCGSPLCYTGRFLSDFDIREEGFVRAVRSSGGE